LIHISGSEVEQVTTTKELFTESITINEQQQLPQEVLMDLTFKKPQPQPQTATVAMKTKSGIQPMKMEVEIKEAEKHISEQTLMQTVRLVAEEQHREEVSFELQPEEKPEEPMIAPEFTQPLENIKVGQIQ
jgi:hypothetical protein